MTIVAVASARKCKHLETGEPKYKPVINYPGRRNGRKSEVCDGGTRESYEQGRLYSNREDAVDYAQKVIDARRMEVVECAKARTKGRCSEAAIRNIQARYEIYQGVGDVFDDADA